MRLLTYTKAVALAALGLGAMALPALAQEAVPAVPVVPAAMNITSTPVTRKAKLLKT